MEVFIYALSMFIKSLIIIKLDPNISHLRQILCEKCIILTLVHFNRDHPDVFLLEYSRVRSVKTQLIYCQITSMTTCFDSQSRHQVNLEPYQFRYIKQQCTFLGSQNVYSNKRMQIKVEYQESLKHVTQGLTQSIDRQLLPAIYYLYIRPFDFLPYNPTLLILTTFYYNNQILTFQEHIDKCLLHLS